MEEPADLPPGKKSGLLIAVAIGAVLIAGYFLWSKGLAPRTSGSRDKGIASLLQKKQTVEIKRAKDLVFIGAVLGMPLFEQDSVKTGDESRATVAFDAGNLIRTDPNTLVVIRNVKESEDKQVEAALDLSAGGLQLALNAIDRSSEMSVQTPNFVTIVSSKRGDKTAPEVDVKVLPDDSTRVRVVTGQARVKTDMGDSVVTPGTDGLAADVNFKRNDQDQSTRILVVSGKTTVQLPTGQAQIESREGKPAVVRFSKKGNELPTMAVLEGSARVETGGQVYDLQANSMIYLDDQHKQGPVVVLPAAPRMLSYGQARVVPKTGAGPVVLGWEPVKEAKTYHAVLASDTDFQKVLLDKIVAETRVRPELGPGVYHFHVSTLDKDGREGAFSESYDFEVTVSDTEEVRRDDHVDVPSVEGGIMDPTSNDPKSRLRAAVYEKAPAVRSCYEKELKKDNLLSGKLWLRATVAADGRVTRALVVDTRFRNTPLAECVIKEARTWMFDAHAGGDNVVEVPFTLTPRGR